MAEAGVYVGKAPGGEAEVKQLVSQEFQYDLNPGLHTCLGQYKVSCVKLLTVPHHATMMTVDNFCMFIAARSAEQIRG